jgi:hypothetical protein
MIVALWKRMKANSVGGAELEAIQQSLLANGVFESPASIARTLADHGAVLIYPEVLEADVRWRWRNVLGPFAPEELNFDTPAAAVKWIEKLDDSYRQLDESGLEQLRERALSLKRELELVAVSERTGNKNRELAQEVVQWLAVWLQNPQIFKDWFALRQNTAEFRQRFES